MSRPRRPRCGNRGAPGLTVRARYAYKPGTVLRLMTGPAPRLLRQLGCLVAVLGSLYGCGDDRFVVIGTPEAPSTSGYVEVDDEDDGVSAIVVLKHLHPPASLSAEFTHYVVWMAGPAGTPRRVGTLEYDPDHRVGTLTTHSPSFQFTVTVTAESSAEPKAPDGLLVAKQEVVYDD